MNRLAYGLLVALVPGMSANVYGAKPPLWELGVGLGALHTPDYRGADEEQTYVVPYPHVIYRGEFLRIDRDKVTGKLLETERLELDLSLAAAPPVDSDQNDARSGMDDLDPVLEFGPSLEILLAGSRTDQGWFLKLPLRKVIATDLSHFEDAGWTFSPYLQYKDRRFGPGGDWTLRASLGLSYASEAYHDYYYEVDPRFATAARPAYSAEGGYSGSRVIVALDKRFEDYWLGGFFRYDELSGAEFEDSPLVRESHAFTVGVAATWFFAKSKKRVDND